MRKSWILTPCLSQRRYLYFNLGAVFFRMWLSQNCEQKDRVAAKKSVGSLNNALVAEIFLEVNDGSSRFQGKFLFWFGSPSKLTILTCLNLCLCSGEFQLMS